MHYPEVIELIISQASGEKDKRIDSNIKVQNKTIIGVSSKIPTWVGIYLRINLYIGSKICAINLGLNRTQKREIQESITSTITKKRINATINIQINTIVIIVYNINKELNAVSAAFSWAFFLLLPVHFPANFFHIYTPTRNILSWSGHDSSSTS